MLTYFVHSTSTDNQTGSRSGWRDPPLSAIGIEQAVSLRELISGRKFDLVYTSDLTRAVQTAKIALPECEIIQDSRLREMNYGVLNGATSATFPTDEMWCVENRFENGENCVDVQKRMEAFLIDRFDPTKEIAIFAHRFPQLAMEVILNGVTWEEAFINDWRTTGDWQPGWTYEEIRSAG